MTSEDKKKNDSIEQTVEKEKVRTDICSQTIQWLAHQESIKQAVKHIQSATLPAENAYFENLLTHIMHNFSHLKTNPEITFNCAERIRGKAVEIIKSMPDNGYILNGDFSDLLDKKLTKSPRLLHKENKTAINKYNFMWADYCCPVNPTLVRDTVKAINNHIDSGVIYVTFCGLTRQEGGRSGMLKRITGKEVKDPTSEEIADSIINAIEWGVPKKKINLIYKVIYGGGKRGGTTMITLGFSINVAKKAIEPIVEDRKEAQRKYNNVYYKMKDKKGWAKKIDGRGRPTKIRKKSAVAIKDQRAKIAIRKKVFVRFNKGWDSKRIVIDLKKTYNLELTTGQVGSMIAWMNPNGKLTKKKVTA